MESKNAFIETCEKSVNKMSDPVEALILDLLEWIGATPRPYAEVIEAWRTSCPRLPVWEEANRLGFIDYKHWDGVGYVSVSNLGRAFLLKRRGTAWSIANK